MKLSNETLKLLENYSKINPSMLFQEGQIIRTVDSDKTMLASAQIKEEFPKDFAIYDLPKFIKVVGMFDNAEIDVGDEETNYCTISYKEGENGGQTSDVVYMYASKEAIEYTEKDIVMPETEINFDLDKDTLEKINRAAMTMALDNVIITPVDENNVLVTVSNIDNPSADSFSIKVKADLDISDFYVVFEYQKIMNLLPRKYSVGISSKQISHFSADDVQYWVAISAHSTFGN